MGDGVVLAYWMCFHGGWEMFLSRELDLTVHLGSPRRLRVIHRTNLAVARSAGGWECLRSKATRPFLRCSFGPSAWPAQSAQSNGHPLRRPRLSDGVLGHCLPWRFRLLEIQVLRCRPRLPPLTGGPDGGKSLFHRVFDAGRSRPRPPGVRRPGAMASALPSSRHQSHLARTGREFLPLAGEIRVSATRARSPAKRAPVGVLAPFPAPGCLPDSRPSQRTERGWGCAFAGTQRRVAKIQVKEAAIERKIK
jgi:hypothetical protein